MILVNLDITGFTDLSGIPGFLDFIGFLGFTKVGRVYRRLGTPTKKVQQI